MTSPVESKAGLANGLIRKSSNIKTSKDMSSGQSVLSNSTNRRLVNYDALIRLFDCPVCHDWVTGPIVQCRKGHIVCGPCKSKGLKACPVCKQRFSDVTNWMMEQVSSLISFPCRFQSHGCPEYHELAHRVGHEALCSYRPVSCHYSVRGCTQVLLFHLMEKHVLECSFKPRLLPSPSQNS